MNEPHFDWIKDVPEWGTFIGTILISFLAMFSNRLKNWFCRPKLKFQIDNTRKYCAFVEDDPVVNEVDATQGDSDFVWCLEVCNRGRQVAKNCRVQCDKVYEESDGGGKFMLKREFISQGFFWQTGTQMEDVVPGKPSWSRLFILSRVSNQGKDLERAPEQKVPVVALHLYLGVERGIKGCYVSLRNKGKNTFLLPIKVYYDGLNSAYCQWIKVHWTDGDSSPSSTNFSIEKLSEKEAKAIIVQ